MLHIAVIGAGQLGSRHLQGLCRLTRPCTLYAIDPVAVSLQRALQRAGEMPANERIAKIITGRDVTELPRQLDLAIIASNADVRLALLSRLLEHCTVPNLLLEKVLFRRDDEYRVAAELLTSKAVQAWVNFPRRLYDCYGTIREFLDGEPITHFHIHGGGWGLGCNGVHFADLFQHLGGRVSIEYRSELLDKSVYPSKRVGFVEFGGTLVGRSDSAALFFTDHVRSSANHLVEIQREGKSCIVDEGRGVAWLLDDKSGARELKFTLPYQSELTATVVNQIIETGRCDLPGYEAATQTHLPFIRCLRDHYSALTGKQEDTCPIT